MNGLKSNGTIKLERRDVLSRETAQRRSTSEMIDQVLQAEQDTQVGNREVRSLRGTEGERDCEKKVGNRLAKKAGQAMHRRQKGRERETA